MNKPVAWIWSEDGCNLGVCLDQDKQIGKQEFQDYDIPLYTNPVKELTDRIEEQEKFIKAILKKGGCDGVICQKYNTHLVKELTDEEIVKLHEETSWFGISDPVKFAKAILRKAQEK